jgi:hypothetical protein
VIALEDNPVSRGAAFVYALPEGTTAAVLRVYTVSGVLVFEVDLDAEDDAYSWDLVSRHGERLAAGLHLYVLVSNQGMSEVGKLVIRP